MYQLFDYQRNLVNQARDALAQGNKGVLIVSPPGSGKSVVIAEIAKLTTLKNKNNNLVEILIKLYNDVN